MCTKITGRTKTLLAAAAATSAVLLFSGVSSAQAFTLLYEDPSDTQKVTGIEDLTIDGTEYDVSFEFGSFNDVFGNIGDLTELEGKTPEFWGDLSGAGNATQAIINALGEDSYLYSDDTDLSDSFLVYHSDDLTGGVYRDHYSLKEDFVWPWFSPSPVYNSKIWPIATFNVVDPPPPPDSSDRVPEPSLILGLIGLGGLMLGDQRKTRG